MDNKAGEVDPWASVGNMAGDKSGETVSAEGLAREAAWSNAMADVPEFGSTNTTQSAPEAPERDKNISEASAIIKYGMNAAAREVGVETVMQTINNFVPDANGDPIKQLYLELGIDTKEEISDLADEAKASKTQENTFLRENANAPISTKRSNEDALLAIKEVKELVSEVKTSPAYGDLREEALHNKKGIFEYAVSKYGVRDLTVLFDALSAEKQKYNKAQAEMNATSQTIDDQAQTSSNVVDQAVDGQAQDGTAATNQSVENYGIDDPVISEKVA